MTAPTGGPILPPGAPTVLAGLQPHARVSDMAACAAAPDVILSGAATVLIGGFPAARMGDATARGGAVAIGLPTVTIGGPVFSARAVGTVRRLRWGLPPWETRVTYGESIEIRPDPDDPSYESRALAALIRLDTTNNMKGAFDAIEASGHTVVVENYKPGPGDDPFNAYCAADDVDDAQVPGKGSSSRVVWNPDVHSMGGPPGTVDPWQEPGSDVILGHEMIHATHNAEGGHGDNWQNDGVAVHEERNTVGLPEQVYQHPHDATGYNGTALPETASKPYTENGLREEYAGRGITSPTGPELVPRPSYYPGASPPF